MQTSILKLEWKRREGGNGRTQRDFLDFVVDGESLFERIGDDKITPLSWFIAEQNTKVVNKLLLKENSELPGNRYPIYVCAECGDLSCGAMTVVIERKDNKIIWRDFGYQNDYEEEIYPVRHSNTYVFDEEQYRNTLKSAL